MQPGQIQFSTKIEIVLQLDLDEKYFYNFKDYSLNKSDIKSKQVKHHKVPRLFVGTKKWQSVRRQNGSGSVQICRENALAVNMEPDGSLKLRVED